MIFTQKTVLTCTLTLAACALCVVFIVSVKSTAARNAQLAQMPLPAPAFEAELVKLQYTQGIRRPGHVDHTLQTAMSR